MTHKTEELRIAIHVRGIDCNEEQRLHLDDLYRHMSGWLPEHVRVALFTPAASALKHSPLHIDELFVLPQDLIPKAMEVFDPHTTVVLSPYTSVTP